MTLEPLLHAPLAVQIHVATVVPAFLIGTYQIFLSRKGEPFHRALGYVYLTLMTITAIAALFVQALMPRGPFFGFSPIHLRMHQRAMLGVYIGGILIAGSLAFLPGRIMHAVTFGSGG